MFIGTLFTKANTRKQPRCLTICQWLYFIHKEVRMERTKMAAEVDTLRLLAQPELTENRTARRSNTKEIKNKHSSRPVGGAETGTGVERTPVAVAGLRLVECGTNGPGSLSTSRPCGPTFAHINPEGGTQEWRRTGQAEQRVAPRGPTFAHR